MLRLGRLRFADRNHSLRALNLRQRDVMLGFDCFKPLLGLTNPLCQLSLFGFLYALSIALVSQILNDYFKRPSLFCDRAYGGHQPLTDLLFEPRTFNRARRLNARSRQLTPEPQKLFGF